MGSLKFRDFDINLSSKNDSDFSNAMVETTIKTGSICTNNDNRDDHLRSDDFLDVEKHPDIKFVSRSFRKVRDNSYKIVGTLLLKM